MVAVVRICIIAALTTATLQLIFFSLAAILPFSTVADPAWERPFMRAHYWEQTLQPVWHLLLMFALAFLAALRRTPSVWNWSSVTFAAFGAAQGWIVTEANQLLAHSELAVSREEAIRFLRWSRPGCAILGLIGLAAAWKLRSSLQL